MSLPARGGTSSLVGRQCCCMAVQAVHSLGWGTSVTQYHLCTRHQASSAADSSLHLFVQRALGPALPSPLSAHVQVDHFGESTTGKLHDPWSAAAACWLVTALRLALQARSCRTQQHPPSPRAGNLHFVQQVNTNGLVNVLGLNRLDDIVDVPIADLKDAQQVGACPPCWLSNLSRSCLLSDVVSAVRAQLHAQRPFTLS